MKIIAFGLGQYYKNRKEKLLSCAQGNIVAYTDNNELLWGGVLDEAPIVSPEDALKMECDAFVIMSSYAKEIYAQLIGMGLEESKILYWEFFYAKMVSGTKRILQGEGSNDKGKSSILIITTDLNYNGGSLAAFYAALAIKKRGYHVVLAVPECDDRLADEVTQKGISIYVCPSLPYVFEREKEWIRKFDVVFINVFQMMQSVLAISGMKPVLWWIHEPIEIMESMRTRFLNCIPKEDFNDAAIYAVSKIPRKNFNTFYPNRIEKILHYGIPDMGQGGLTLDKNKEKVVFAIIGGVCEGKAQDIFCKAVKKLENKEKAEFWIIGQYGKGKYSEAICRMARQEKSIKMCGLMTREEIYHAFPEIDVVVCASRKDSLPIVMTEGMMFGKVCITTDATGTADYIEEGENGFIVPAEDVDALAGRMEWILAHRDKLAEIGKKARKTYEDHFTMEIFGENLERALLETKREWDLRKERV